MKYILTMLSYVDRLQIGVPKGQNFVDGGFFPLIFIVINSIS